MARFRHSISWQLLSAFAALSLLVLILAGIGWTSFNRAADTIESIYQERVVRVRDLKIIADLYTSTVANSVYQVRAGTKPWETAFENIANAREEIGMRWTRVAAMPMSDEERMLADDAGQKIEAAVPGLKRLLEVLRHKDPAELDRFLREMPAIVEPVAELLDQLAGIQLDNAQNSYSQFMEFAFPARLLLAIAVVVAVVTMLFGFIAVIRRVTGPLRDITGLMERLATGNLDVEVAYAKRKDEIGRLARALSIFKEEVAANRRLEAEKQADLASKTARAENLTVQIRRFEDSVVTLLDVVDSRNRQTQTNAGAMAEATRSTMKEASAAAGTAEQMALNVETVAAAIEEMSTSIMEVGHQIKRSSAVAETAVKEAKRISDSIGRLAEAGDNIWDAVGLISIIAKQTNMLALNATIEAARAGDAGRGFAVVAGEVKVLASQTAQATQRITEHVASIREATNNTVAAIELISGTIAEMNTNSSSVSSIVEEQAAVTRTISANVQAAATGTQLVSSAIGTVTHMMKNNTDSTDHAMVNITGLIEDIDTLRKEVHNFLGSLEKNDI